MLTNSKQPARHFDWPAVGNDNLLEFLDNSLSQHKLAQTYVFAGPEDLGKSTVALAFARNLIISDTGNNLDFSSVNSDLHILSRESGKKNISIEAVRDFIKMLSLSSFLNSYKIGVIKEADTLSQEAASALLKTLEEPREKVIIILLTSSIDLLLPTIVSRSQVLYFYPVPFDTVYNYLVKELDLKRTDAKDMAALAAGRPLLAARFVENPEVYDRQLATARLFLNFFNQNIPQRLKAWSSFLNNQALSVAYASEVLQIWQRTVRDLVLVALNCPELIEHMALIKELNAQNSANSEDSLRYYSTILELLDTLQKYLAANVAPATVIEQVIYNL